MSGGVRPAFLALVVSLSLVGCGGSPNAESGERPAGGISANDQRVLQQIQTRVRAWNRAAAPWVTALQGDDTDRFIAVHDRSVKPLGAAVAGIGLGASQLSDAGLRGLVAAIGRDYRRQFNAMVDVGDGVAAGKTDVVNRALARMRRANRHKSAAAERLVDRFPELGREF